MTRVLRIVRQARWDSPGDLDWLAGDDIPAPPLLDFANTCNDCLSVWLVGEGGGDEHRIVTALAATRDKLDVFDYVLFAREHLDAARTELRAVGGDTADEGVNRHHRDLAPLSAARVLAITKKVWHEGQPPTRLSKRQVGQLIADAVRAGRIPMEGLSPKLREDIRRRLQNGPSEPPRPTQG